MKFKEKFMMYDFESDSNLYTLSLIDGINYVGRIDFSKKHNVITIVFIFVDASTDERDTQLKCYPN